MFYEEPADEMQDEPMEDPAAFIPPAPERTGRNPRMPRLDELPIPAQNQLRQREAQYADHHPEKKRATLLQRLAAVGLGRREEDAEAHHEPAMNRQPEPQPRNVREGAYRPAKGNLDPHGRQQQPARGMEDELEIPAFLRRQAN